MLTPMHPYFIITILFLFLVLSLLPNLLFICIFISTIPSRSYMICIYLYVNAHYRCCLKLYTVLFN